MLNSYDNSTVVLCYKNLLVNMEKSELKSLLIKKINLSHPPSSRCYSDLFEFIIKNLSFTRCIQIYETGVVRLFSSDEILGVLRLPSTFSNDFEFIDSDFEKQKESLLKIIHSKLNINND